MSLIGRLLVILSLPVVLIVAGFILCLHAVSFGSLVAMTGMGLLPLAPYWAYPIIDKLEGK